MKQQSGHQDDASSTAARVFHLPKQTLNEPFSPDSARLRFPLEQVKVDVLSLGVELHSYTDSLCSAWIIEVVK